MSTAAADGNTRTPPDFGNPAAEYEAAAHAAAMFDVSGRAQIELTGNDRATFLHNFCTNDIKRLQPGQGCEAFVTNVKGRILGHILVFAEEKALWIDSDAGTAAGLVAHLERYIITEDVQLRDRTAEMGQLLICGPEAAGFIERVLNVPVDGVQRYGHVAAEFAGTPVRIRRVPFTVVPGLLLSLPTPQVGRLWEAFVAAGVVRADRTVREVLRIEAVYPQYGVDLTEDHLAHEAARTKQAISFTKGCYLGQEPIARLDALGHTNRELRGLRFEASQLVPPQTRVFDAAGTTEVGQITSIANRPTDNRPVALAMLRTTVGAPGTQVMVRHDDLEIAAVVYSAPDPG